MATATLNLRVSPRRMLSEREADEYVALPLAVFRSDCTVAAVLMPRGKRLFDMQDLDQWIDNLKGGVANTYEDILRKLA